MADHKLAELLKTQQSMTEWFEDIKHADTEALRHEDNEKRERLKELNRLIGLPFDEPTQFKAEELKDDNKKFQKFLKEHGGETCALRLIPLDKSLPKLRMRGKTIADAYIWYKEQKIDPKKYRADFVPHSDINYWATIFIVNKHGIQGEIVYGGHNQLTQGFYDKEPPTLFHYDFKNWLLSPENPEALKYLKELIKYIKIDDKKLRVQVTNELGSSYVNNYLEGYFESTNSPLGTWYIDYSQVFGKMFNDLNLNLTGKSKLKTLVNGRVASSGKASGKVQIVSELEIDKEFEKGSVLVCAMTSPKYVPLMKKASAIITDMGGILSHAAIIARELKKPCIVGTGNATSVLKNGQTVLVDADNGQVTEA